MKNPALIKIVALSATSAVPIFFLGKTLAGFSPDLGTLFLFVTDLPLTISLLVIFVWSAALLSLLPSFNLERNAMILTVILPTITFVIPQFLGKLPNLPLILLGAGILTVALLRLGFSIRATIVSRVKLHVWEIFPAKVGGLMTALALIFALVYGGNYYLQINHKGFSVPDAVLDKAFDLAAPIIEKQLASQIEQQFDAAFRQAGITDEAAKLQFLKSEAIETLGEGQGRQEIGLTPENLDLGKITITPEGKLDVSQILADMKPKLKAEIETALTPYQKFIPPVAGVLIFLTLHFLGRLAALLSPIFIYLLIKILTLSGFVQVKKEMVEAERYRL